MSIKKIFSLSLVLGILAVGAKANDSNATGIGGRWRMLKGEETTVQMVREHVRIVPSGDEFQTTADFVFRNHGPATTVVMGFPEAAYGVDHEDGHPEEEPVGLRRFHS
jgi:hypothetical protein